MNGEKVVQHLKKDIVSILPHDIPPAECFCLRWRGGVPYQGEIQKRAEDSSQWRCNWHAPCIH